MRIYRTENERQTYLLGESLGRSLKGTETIAFFGEPGAGKTIFSKGIAKGLEIGELVTSPTFTIMNEYSGRAPLFHYDMYRISDPSELDEVGFFENLGRGVTIVEWSENIESVLPADVLKIEIEYDGEERKITIHEDIEL